MDKEAYNKRKRELYQINKERELNRKKLYRDNLSDEKKESNKEYSRLKCKEWREKNKEKIKINNKLYREKKKAESKKILP